VLPAKITSICFSNAIFFGNICGRCGSGLAVGNYRSWGGLTDDPLLLMFGFPPYIAIGTILMYAGIAKSTGLVMPRPNVGNVNCYNCILPWPLAVCRPHFMTRLGSGHQYWESRSLPRILTGTLGRCSPHCRGDFLQSKTYQAIGMLISGWKKMARKKNYFYFCGLYS